MIAGDEIPPTVEGALIRTNPLKPAMAKLSITVQAESRVVRFQASVTNATSEVFRFDRIEKSCSCQDVKPTSGNVEPGEKIVFTIEQELSEFSHSQTPGGSFQLISNGLPDAMVSYDILLDSYLGFGARFVDLSKKQKENSVEFFIPIVLGEKQSNAAEESLTEPFVELVGFPSKFKLTTKMNWNRSGLDCKLDVPTQASDYPYVGKITLTTEYQSGLLTIPVSLSSGRAFQIHPLSLRFRRGEGDDNGWIAIAFLKCEASDAKPIVDVIDGPSSLRIGTKSLGGGIKKLEFHMKVPSSSTDPLPNRQARELSVRVRGAKLTQIFNLRFTTPTMRTLR
ncbi:hypothetical protein [Rubripirellula amarantea]|uniref:hypothetical protein n=1 Tax=Rubripirellula amarantea TaxID=2527999 RepID=UPI0011B717F5|nr:hypothetical protein [Rubripirellula amarantea]